MDDVLTSVGAGVLFERGHQRPQKVNHRAVVGHGERSRARKKTGFVLYSLN
jgi:hypothetical protein